ncbi:MAG TPA: type I glutamate--ammonia ligase [Planctomycetaceae bacterium]|nr:type I glutamate--ammonia ligase [Planctomycetaceae bacterium]
MDRRTNTTSPQEVLALCREREVRAADLRFTDLFGKLHQLTVPISQLTEQAFRDGFGFDASSIRGWQSVAQSDMLLVPHPTNVWIDPFNRMPTVVLRCNVEDPITREEYSLDPRQVAIRAETYLANTGVADTAFLGPEAEFFIFDQVQFDQRSNGSHYQVESDEAWWNRGANSESNLGHKMRRKEGYLPTAPNDQCIDIRNDMMQTLIESGIEVECHHHEVAAAGQSEINIRYSRLVEMADTLMNYKYIVKNVARRNGKTVTFMPKPLVNENGNGMHVHFSFWKNEEPLFAGGGYAGLSDTGLHAIGGVLKHARALFALTNPTTNSYKRLVPGFEAPVSLGYAARNRSAAIRIPMVSPNPAARRVELRFPDPSCNPYLAFAGVVMAAIDGIQNKIHPGDPEESQAYKDSESVATAAPRSLEEALDALEADCDFLLRGDVFTEQLLRDWISHKRQSEIAPMQSRPHPYEYCLYFDT